jgi:DNA-directed RNA polymerase specialized sigma24 family protein
MANSPLPVEMTVPELATACGEQTELFRRSPLVGSVSKADHDDSFCLELFRRAILRQSDDAWQVIIAQYQRLVITWICQRLDCDRYEPDDLVNEAFARFQRSFTSDKFQVYGQLQPLLAYLKRCTHTAVCDFQRRQRRHEVVVESLDDEGVIERLITSRTQLEQEVIASLQAQHVWHIVLNQCQSEAEKKLARRVFIEGWKPDEVHFAEREHYPTVQAVYSALRNLRDRLKRDATMTALLQE